MTRKQFEALPHRNDIEEFNSLIILPLEINLLSVLLYKSRCLLSKMCKWFSSPELYSIKGMHDSGYRCMDFVAVKNGKAICLLSGCSDVIHIDGICGFGFDWLKKYNTVPKLIPPTSWSIDCLSNSGLLHIWPGSGKMTCGDALSSFEIYSMENKKP